MDFSDIPTASQAARTLIAPPDHVSLAAADAHLRAVQDSPSGWAVGRALLGTPDDELHATNIRVVGASLLRAKARADGFAMSAEESATMTGELLTMLGGAAGSGPLGPHLACLAASIAAAGGADTLVDLVTRAIAHAAPDSVGGWPVEGPIAVGPNAPAAVALLAAAAEEGLHRPRAHSYEITEAMQDCLDDVLWVLEAVLSTSASPAAASRDDHPAAAAAAAAAAAVAFKCLHVWIPAGVTLSELATDKPNVLQALLLGALRNGWGGDTAVCSAATEPLEELVTASDPLPGRSIAINAVMVALSEACSALADVAETQRFGDGVDYHGNSHDADHIAPRLRSVTAIAGAVAAVEAPAFAAHVETDGRPLEWLLRALELGGPRTVVAALAPWQRVAGGLACALGAEKGAAACERLVACLLRRLVKTVDAMWDAELALAMEAVSADRSCGGGGGGGGGGGDGESIVGGPHHVDDDDELSFVPDLEAAVAAVHAALGSPRFLTIIQSALSAGVSGCGPSPEFSGWENIASALHVLAACGYPLAPETPAPPVVNALLHALVINPPACLTECAPLAAARAKAVRTALLSATLGDARALACSMHSLLVGLGGGIGKDASERAAVANAAASALAATVGSAASNPASAAVIHPMLSRCEEATAGGTLVLPASERGAVMSALCAVAIAMTDPTAAAAAVDALAAGPCGRLRTAANAGDGVGVVGELRVLLAWVASEAPPRASEACLEEVWSVTGSLALMARKEAANGAASVMVAVVRMCCELWKRLAAALTWPGREEHAAKALSAIHALMQGQDTGSVPGAISAPALGVVAALVEVCGSTASHDCQACTSRLVLDATYSLARTCSGRATSEPEALVSLFTAATATLRAKHAFAVSCLNEYANGDNAALLIRLATNLSRSAEVEPTRAALGFLEAVWSSATFVPADATGAGSSATGLVLVGVYGQTLGASLAAASVECTTPQLLEPIARALWAAANRCNEDGGEGLSAWLSEILVKAVTRGEGLESTRAIEGVRAGAVSEADVVGFARAVAERRPLHPALRIAELVTVFGRACRGQGPASEIADFA